MHLSSCQEKNGTAAACISADIAAIHKIEASYKIPKRKLPINQDTPNPVSKSHIPPLFHV